MKEIEEYNDTEFRERLLKFFQKECQVAVGHPIDNNGIVDPLLIYYELRTKKQHRLNFAFNGDPTEVANKFCLEMGYIPPKNHDAILAFLDVRKKFYNGLLISTKE